MSAFGKSGTKSKKLTASDLRKEQAKIPVEHAGLSFGQKHEILLAKLKRGELWALNHLLPENKAVVTPLFEVCPPVPPRVPKAKPGEKAKPAKPAKPLNLHVRDLLTVVRDEWTALPFFLDTRYVPKGGIPTDTAAKTIFDGARTLGLAAVPVTSLQFSVTFQEEIARVIALDKLGVMIRLHIENFSNPSLLPGYLNGIQRLLGVSPEEIDILVDLKHRPAQAEVTSLGQSCLASLPNMNEWRTVTLASGCFPSSISEWALDEWIQLERSDWLGWNDVRQARSIAGGRIPSYGDYGVRCGGPPPSQSRRSNPNLRYTCKTQVITRRGNDVDGEMKAICASLVGKPEFAGAAFSRGDDEIQLRADALGSPNNGQAEQWIEWSTNHHLTMTAQQIRSLA